jgi:hypothetical protein
MVAWKATPILGAGEFLFGIFSVIEELLERKSSRFGPENRDYGHRDSSR